MSSQIPQNHNPIKHLREFYAPQQKLFRDAVELPQFFQTNLVDDSRVVKYFPNDPQANLIIFYYQYLKLCFEIDNVDYESYIQKIYELIRTQGFEFYFDDNDKQKQYKNAQYKSLLIDFFEVMNSSSMTIDEVLSQYPILDQVFINFFRSVLMIASVTNEYDSYIDKNELFDFLSSFFSVDISSYDKCLKFLESDIFVYEQDPENIYMAYIRDDEEEDGQQEHQSTQQNNEVIASKSHSSKFAMNSKGFTISEQVSENTLPEDNKESIAPSSQFTSTQQHRAKVTIKESYIEGEFADYTSYHIKGISAFGKNLTSDSEKEIHQAVEHKLTSYQENEQGQSNIQQISEIQYKDETYNQHKRILPDQNQVRFDLDPTYDQQEFSEGLTSYNKGNLSNNKLSSNNNQKLIESLYDQAQNGTVKFESKQQLEQEEMSNSKDDVKKQIAPNRNLLYQNYQEPTKDPGFSNIQGINVRPVESTIYHTTQPKSMAASYESNTVINQQKPNNLYEPLFHKPSIPVPTLLNQNTLSANSRMVSSSKEMKDSQSSGTVNSNIVSVRQNFKLNVTKQFTNSIVMKSMHEPFKSNVYKMRERAREFRQNLYKEFSYQPTNTTSSNEYKMTKNPSSKTNLPSSSTLEKALSSKYLEIESNVKVQPVIRNLINQDRQKIQSKVQSQSNYGLLSKKLFDVTPSVTKQSLNLNVLQIKDQAYIVKETKQQSQVQNKFGPIISSGPSIITNRQNQYQNQQFPQHANSHPMPQLAQSGPYPTNKFNPYQTSQQNLYKGPDLNPYQMNKPPSYNDNKIQTSPSMFYSNNLQSTEPIKMYKDQPMQMNKEQTNHAVYMQGNKGHILRTPNQQEMFYNQPMKRTSPVFVPYERKT